MFKKKNKEVKLGDQFIDFSGEIKKTWEVIELVNRPHLPLHARIREIGREEAHLTSVSALLDENLYKPIEDKSENNFLKQKKNKEEIVNPLK